MSAFQLTIVHKSGRCAIARADSFVSAVQAPLSTRMLWDDLSALDVKTRETRGVDTTRSGVCSRRQKGESYGCPSSEQSLHAGVQAGPFGCLGWSIGFPQLPRGVAAPQQTTKNYTCDGLFAALWIGTLPRMLSRRLFGALPTSLWWHYHGQHLPPCLTKMSCFLPTSTLIDIAASTPVRIMCHEHVIRLR